MESTSNVSRRGFVGAAAMGGLAVASLGSAKGALADEQAVTEPQILYVPEVPEAWDLEAEIVVLGSGIAGSCAAVEAYDLGMDVLLVTAAGGITECDCTLSGGSLAGCGTELQEAAGIEDDVEVMVKDILRCGGEMNDPDVIRAWAMISGETVDWLEELGCEVSETIVNASSNSIDRCHRSLPVGDGLGWMLGLEKAIEERDLNVMFETRGTKLYRDEKGRVVGCLIQMPDGTEKTVRALKGVVLATGGLGNSKEMWSRYNPYTGWVIENARKVVFTGSDANHGDGIAMATAIGADASFSPANYGGGGVQVGPAETKGSGNFLPHRWSKVGVIEVTSEGKRFNDETNFGDFYGDGKKFINTPGLWSVAIFDDVVRQSDEGQTYAQDIIDLATANGMPSVCSADTIEELCEFFGLDVEQTKATVEEYNTHVDSGEPDEFGRTEFLNKIAQPPFWGVEFGISLATSKGGLAINPKGQVLDVRGVPIERLYAAGEVAFARILGDARIHVTGGQNGAGAAYGRICARSINELEPLQ